MNAIKTKGSAIAAEQQKQYDAEEAYATHLDRIGTVYERKIAALPGLKTTLGAGGGLPAASAIGQAQATASTAPAASSGFAPKTGQAQPVEDIATPPAIDAMSGYLGNKLDGVRDDLKSLADWMRTLRMGRSRSEA